MTRILLVDDEPALVRALTINLRARGYDVHTAGTVRTGQERPRRILRILSYWTSGFPTWTAVR